MSKERILVVDDEQGIREDLNEFLSDQGYQVGLAEDGSKALKAFEQESYALVFMDIKMPGIDGIETLRRMKKAKPETKIVIITGLPDEETFERAASVVDGTIEGFIAKPFKPDDLIKCLEKVLGGEKLPSFSLTPEQENALTEIGKSGAQNASQSLAKIIKEEIEIVLEKVQSLSLKKFLEAKEKTEMPIVGALAHLQGDITGRMAVLLSWESGLNLIDLSMGQPGGTTKTFSETGLGTVKSVVAVLSKSYLSAVSKLLNLSTTSSLPTVFFDTEEAILQAITKEFAEEYIFTMETELSVVESKIRSRILLIPDTDSLKVIFKSMNVFKG